MLLSPPFHEMITALLFTYGNADVSFRIYPKSLLYIMAENGDGRKFVYRVEAAATTTAFVSYSVFDFRRRKSYIIRWVKLGGLRREYTLFLVELL